MSDKPISDLPRPAASELGGECEAGEEKGEGSGEGKGESGGEMDGYHARMASLGVVLGCDAAIAFAACPRLPKQNRE